MSAMAAGLALDWCVPGVLGGCSLVPHASAPNLLRAGLLRGGKLVGVRRAYLATRNSRSKWPGLYLLSLSDGVVATVASFAESAAASMGGRRMEPVGSANDPHVSFRNSLSATRPRMRARVSVEHEPSWVSDLSEKKMRSTVESQMAPMRDGEFGVRLLVGGRIGVASVRPSARIERVRVAVSTMAGE